MSEQNGGQRVSQHWAEALQKRKEKETSTKKPSHSCRKWEDKSILLSHGTTQEDQKRKAMFPPQGIQQPLHLPKRVYIIPNIEEELIQNQFRAGVGGIIQISVPPPFCSSPCLGGKFQPFMKFGIIRAFGGCGMVHLSRVLTFFQNVICLAQLCLRGQICLGYQYIESGTFCLSAFWYWPYY